MTRRDTRTIPRRRQVPARVIAVRRKTLTPISIAALKPRRERYELSDGGCAGLRIVVFPSRHKSYIVRYRFGGVQRKVTLGSATPPDIAETLDAPVAGVPLT